MFRYGTFNQDISSWDVSSELIFRTCLNTIMRCKQVGVDANPDRSYFLIRYNTSY